MTETYRKSQVLAVIKNYFSIRVPIHACRSFLKFGVSTFVRDALRCLGSVRERCQREQGARRGRTRSARSSITRTSAKTARTTRLSASSHRKRTVTPATRPMPTIPTSIPALQWAGKAERTSFEIPTVSLHVHERIDPRSIIEAVRKKNGEDFVQGSLFSRLDENPPIREAIEFYKHKHNWSNRLIAGDSLLVMNSLLEKEGMAGKVQMVYLDPPYGIEYKSNFQPFLTSRDVKDKDEDLTQEPETIRAFRDTWQLEIHSYLAYLRDRLLLCRDLLSDTGSIFVQINDENLSLVHIVMSRSFRCRTILSFTFRSRKRGARKAGFSIRSTTILSGSPRTKRGSAKLTTSSMNRLRSTVNWWKHSAMSKCRTEPKSHSRS